MSSTVIAKNVQIGADGTASNNFTIFQPATPDGTLRIGNGNTGITSSAVALTSAGNVGIGTSSPLAGTKLSINGSMSLIPYYSTYLVNSYYDGAWKYAGNGVAWGIGNNFGGTTNGTTIAVATSNSGGSGASLTWNPAFNIDTSGNVGIGTSSPATKLDVSGKVKVTAIELGASEDLTTNLYYSGGWKYRGTGYGTVIGAASGAITFSNTASSGSADGAATVTERARFDSSGNLLVGITSGQNKLLVNDNVDRAQAAAQVNIQGNGYNLFFHLDGTAAYIGQNSNSRVLRMYSGGNTAVGVNLGVGGNSWGTYSDERVKDIIEPIENGVEKLSGLRTVIGKYKFDETNKRRVFLIAQDVQKVLPEAVIEDTSGDLSLQYQDLIPVLVKAIQEQQAIITALTARVTALEGTQP